jgi:type II secretory pathway pseudopilin PulG
MVEVLITAIIGIIAGVGGTTVYGRKRAANGKNKADQLIATANVTASDVVVKAKDDEKKESDASHGIKPKVG